MASEANPKEIPMLSLSPGRALRTRSQKSMVADAPVEPVPLHICVCPSIFPSFCPFKNMYFLGRETRKLGSIYDESVVSVLSQDQLTKS